MKINIFDKKYQIVVILSLLLSVFLIFSTFVSQVVSFMDKILVVEIVVKGASDEVKNVISKRLEDVIGTPITSVDLSQISLEVNNIPWVQYGSVYRSLNGIIIINVIEVTPYFLWINDDSRYKIITSDNRLAHLSTNFDIKNLITIEKGSDALVKSNDLRFVIYKDLKVLSKIKTLRYNGYRWDIILKNGVIIKMPEKNIKKAYESIIKFNDKFNILDKNIEYIDATAENKLFIKPNFIDR